ncbi:MAG: hypothetical protein WCK84_11070 [Bacteroidota bacterium]
MKIIQNILVLVLLSTGLSRVNAQTTSEIASANKAGKNVFLIAYNAPGADLDKAVTIANGARKNLTSTTAVVKMNTTDAANSALVAKYRLAGAPSPLILVLDKKGNPAGGYVLNEATSGKLVDLIPSPKTAEVTDAITNGKSVLLIVYKESMKSKKSIMDNCAIACSQMSNKSVVVKIDLGDKKETKLLQTLKCDLLAKEPVTYTINAAGQVTGTFTGITDVNSLIASAKKAPAKAGGCCPSGAPAGGCK